MNKKDIQIGELYKANFTGMRDIFPPHRTLFIRVNDINYEDERVTGDITDENLRIAYPSDMEDNYFSFRELNCEAILYKYSTLKKVSKNTTAVSIENKYR